MCLICFLEVKLCGTATCYNGGRCLNIPGSFRCDCAAGFTGANCRVNINECEPSPCFGGGRCEDGVNSFTCICRKNRSGALCESKINGIVLCRFSGISGLHLGLSSRWEKAVLKTSFLYLKPEDAVGKHRLYVLANLNSSYEYSSIIFFSCSVEKRPDNCQRNHKERDHGSSWRESCNTCTCDDGAVKCTRVLCPPQNCISEDLLRCEPGSRCIEIQNVSCLREPCPRFGECVGKDGKQEKEGDIEAMVKLECDPRSNEVSDDCAKVHIVFSKDKLPIVSNH